MISFSNGTAGKTTTDEELEEMLDGGNAAVFTAGVCSLTVTASFFWFITNASSLPLHFHQTL